MTVLSVDWNANIINNYIMENRQQQILSEIMEMMSSIRVQLEQLDAKMAELQYEVDPQPFTEEPIDIELEEMPVTEFSGTAVEPVMELVPELTDEHVEEDLPEPAEDTVAEDLPEVSVESVAGKQAVIDALTARQAWRKDMPGAPVRDIRSAISLNDRVLFINGLFDEDPAAFQEALTALNQMSTLDDAVEYLASGHPAWDFESEIVYRFMMALRRKIS